MVGLFYIHSSGTPFVAIEYDNVTSELALAPTTLLIPEHLKVIPKLRFRLNEPESLKTFKSQFVCFGLAPHIVDKIKAKAEGASDAWQQH